MFRTLLLALALSAPTAAHAADWWRAETAHFIIYSEDDESDTRAFATELERFDNALRTLQGRPVRPPEPLSDANKVTIFRTGDTDDIAYLAGAPESGIAGFYIPRAGGAVAFTPARRDGVRAGAIGSWTRDRRTDLDPRSVLQHEYVHHFMLQTFPATYPDWYIEAFAELNATIALNDDGSFHVGNPPQYRAAQIFQLPDIRLDELFDQNDERQGLDHIQFYGYGWLLLHYLSFEPTRQGQLMSYLKALGRGEDGLTAARAAFGDLDKLAKEIRTYKHVARSGKFPGYDVKPADYVPPTVDLRALTEAETAVIDERMRTRRGVDLDEARDVAGDIEDDARLYADSVFVQLEAAEAFLGAHRFADADAAADRALALDPESTDALILKASAAIAQGENGDKARFAAARPILIKAARLDSQDPRPFILYYRSFTKAGETPPEDAVVGLKQAFGAAASDQDYRMLLARELLIEGDASSAKVVLLPIAYSFHGNDEQKNKVRPVIGLIDASKLSEARAKIDEIFRDAEKEKNKD
jgi:hypothetical protein